MMGRIIRLSFKTKLLQTIFWGYGDLWMGSTTRLHGLRRNVD